MTQALYVRVYDEEPMLAPEPGFSPGEIVQAPSGRAGVIQGQRPLEEGEPAIAKTTGIYDVASASATTFDAGVIVGWNDTDKLAVAGGAGDFNIGTAQRAKVNGETVVRVVLNDNVAVEADLQAQIDA